MTKEDRILLLKDLCSRLPWGVKIKVPNEDYDDLYGDLVAVYRKNDHTYPEAVIIENLNHRLVSGNVDFGRFNLVSEGRPDYYLKPFLRPLSDMTEEEKKEIEKDYIFAICGDSIRIAYHSEGYWDLDTDTWSNDYIDLIEWLNSHHFDYRGLIKRGLALVAPKDMYKAPGEVEVGVGDDIETHFGDMKTVVGEVTHKDRF